MVLRHGTHSRLQFVLPLTLYKDLGMHLPHLVMYLFLEGMVVMVFDMQGSAAQFFSDLAKLQESLNHLLYLYSTAD
jgi:hypothetical protein